VDYNEQTAEMIGRRHRLMLSIGMIRDREQQAADRPDRGIGQETARRASN
jgi:hypothetical protein